IFEILGAFLDKGPATALGAVRELNQRGANLESLGRDLLEMIRNLAVAKLPATHGSNTLLADLPDQEAAELERLATQASGRDLMRLFRLMAEAQEQLAHSSYPDLMLEMTMIRMATLAPVLDADELMRAIGTAGGGNDDSSTAKSADDRRPPGSVSAETERKQSRGADSLAEKAGPETTPATGEPASSNPIEINSGPARRIRFEGEV